MPQTLQVGVFGVNRISTSVGFDDDAPTGEAAFLVYADDQVVAQSGSMTAGQVATLTANLEGANLLRLVTEAGDSNDGDHTDWAIPRLYCGNSEEPVTKVLTLFSFEGTTDEERLAGWHPVNVIADGSGTVTPSQAFVTDGEYGLEIIPPNSGNWFGASFDPPVDLTGYMVLKYDIQGVDVGSVAEIAVQAGPDWTWCQGGMWSWVSAGTNRIDNVRAELSGE